MEEALHLVAQYLALVLEALALGVIAIGAVEAAVGIVRVMLVRRTSDVEKRAVWLGFAHWLVAGLTFQLAADIVHTTITPSWDEIGRVAAIAAIRTFLTFFLDRDIEAEYRRGRASDARRT
jgi:uncharacterized membrane protein